MAATDRTRHASVAAALLLLGAAGAAQAGTLPEERADVMYHRYDGGGVTIDGPAMLVRKNFDEKYSVSATYYVDQVSSASIDVVTTASAYTEERKQYGVGFDWLHGKTSYGIGFSNSKESDYEGNTGFLGITQSMFGDLTTVTLAHSRGWDTVGKRGDAAFSERVDRRTYEVALSQVISRNFIAGATYEAVTEEGFLRNPYRSVRYADPFTSRGYAYESERYPRTRTSNAIALRGKYFLPWTAAVGLDYRFYDDTWGVRANTAELTYTQPIGSGLTFDGRLRYYQQTRADFYSDLFARSNFQNFLARDKELSTFDSLSAGVGVTYAFLPSKWKFVDKGTVTFSYDFFKFSYDDFRDVRVTGVAAGTEPTYTLNANVIQLYVSAYF